jgi:hypothetical protein
MASIQVRSFNRRDRQQLTDLVNAHAAAVVPGMGVSVSTVLSEMERQAGQFIVDPWVRERATLVAEQRDRVAAAAHLLRYYEDERAGQAYRGSGEIRWLLFWARGPGEQPVLAGCDAGCGEADRGLYRAARGVGRQQPGRGRRVARSRRLWRA